MDRPEIQVNDYCWLENCVVKVIASVDDKTVLVAHNDTVKPYPCDRSMLIKLSPEEVQEYKATMAPLPEGSTYETVPDVQFALYHGTFVKVLGQLDDTRVAVCRPGRFHGFTVSVGALEDLDPKQRAEARQIFGSTEEDTSPIDESDVPLDVPLPVDQPDEKTLADELSHLLNAHSRENASDTPDFILAQYMMRCLVAFEEATRSREAWYGKHTDPVQVQVLYAIGQQKDGGFGFSEFTHGPTPELESLLKEDGHNANSYVVTLNDDGSATPIYQWIDRGPNNSYWEKL